MMSRAWRIVLLFAWVAPDAMAYLDPGSGSLVAQIVIALLASLLATVRVWWGFFRRKGKPPGGSASKSRGKTT